MIDFDFRLNSIDGKSLFNASGNWIYTLYIDESIESDSGRYIYELSISNCEDLLDRCLQVIIHPNWAEDLLCIYNEDDLYIIEELIKVIETEILSLLYNGNKIYITML